VDTVEARDDWEFWLKHGGFLMKVKNVALLVLSLSLASWAMAAKNPNPDITRRELLSFDNFLDTHSAIDADLTKNPRLIESADYIASHPELKSFLAAHPGVREEMKETPRFFMHREAQLEKSGRDIRYREAASFDVFLDAHPGFEKQFRKNPDIVNNPEFLSKHPEFSEFLAGHSRLKNELSENPRAFLKREKELERDEKKEARENSKQERREEKKEERKEERKEAKQPVRTAGQSPRVRG
jgi:hypothetical protein